MNESLDDFKKRTGDKRAEREAAHRPQIEMLAQAQVKTELLTGDAHWDWFLSFLQAAVDHTEGQRDAFAAIIADPKTVQIDTIMEAKIGLAECKARLDAWNAVISLPKDLIEMGQEAKTLLERMPASAEAASS